MNKILLVGFKGVNNASKMLVEQLSSEYVLLTNSFAGLKRDIDSLNTDYESVLMFGVDKNLTSTVRIEKCAEKDGQRIDSGIDLEKVAETLGKFGIKPYISKAPTAYLCNEAYWYLLKKYSGSVVLIHIPTIKHFDYGYIDNMKLAFGKMDCQLTDTKGII